MGTINNASANIGRGVRYAAASSYDPYAFVVRANFGATTLTYTPPSGFNSGLYV